MTQRRLLAILAHPDDESFGLGGTLARYARQDVEVHVCTVTDGAAGSTLHQHPGQSGESRQHPGQSGGSRQHPELVEGEPAPGHSCSLDVVHPGGASALARLRRQELACACQVLGVHLHTLNYRDSGMAGAPDNQHPDSLYQADLDEVARDLLRVMHQVRPHVVLTHDPTGGYFHPDHIKVNHAVRRAWDRLGDVQAYPTPHPTNHESRIPNHESRIPNHESRHPARLYYTVLPRSALKWFLRILRLLGRDPRRFGQNQDVDLTQVGVPDEQIHVRLDVGPYLAVKERASACHRSQGGGSALRTLPAFLRRRFMRYEHFLQAEPPGNHPHGDLFEGLDVTAFERS